MKIKSLTASGFKSFCDQTKVIFDNSLTAVVGPNGCGKSNIVDAIRWGLGEQSAKNLRGKGMEDIIFNGSEHRGPQSMAEVTITFDNTDGLSHPSYSEYPEIAVTRRLSRDGTSDYLINKNPCRLKDITELFMGTGGGARAYSIIEQGRIGLIVSSRSEDRRFMIEEAAGITRFKKARALAQRKMEKTRQNLLRVTDVVAEMERQLSNLKRAAKKAERYKNYAEEQRDKELHMSAHRYLELCALRKVAAAQLQSADEEHKNAQEALDTFEANVEVIRSEEIIARHALDEAKAKSSQMDNAIKMLESEISHLKDTLERLRREEITMLQQEEDSATKIENLEQEQEVIKARLGALETDSQSTSACRDEKERLAKEAREELVNLGEAFESKRDRMSRAKARSAASNSAYENLHRRIEEIEARLDVTRMERSDLEKRINEFKQLAEDMAYQAVEAQESMDKAKQIVKEESEALERLSEELETCDAERLRVRDELQAKRSRLESLQEMHSGLERHDGSVKEAVEALRTDNETGFLGLLVDFIECPEDYELALAAALNDSLQALVTENHESGMALLTWLKDKELGRVTAVPVVGTKPVVSPSEFSDGAVMGCLVDFLKVDPKVSEIVQSLLGNVFVVASTDIAAQLITQSAGQASFVTLDGQLIDDKGVMRGGRAGSPGADLLGQRRQIKALEQEVDTLKSLHSNLEERFAYLKEDIETRRIVLEDAKTDAQRQEFSLAEAHKDKQRALDDLEGATQRFDSIGRDIALQEDALSETRLDRDHAASEMAETREEIASLEQVISEHMRMIEACRSKADTLAADASDARVKEAQFEQQYAAAVERSKQIVTSISEVEWQIGKLADRKLENARETGTTCGKIVKSKEILSTKLDAVTVESSTVKELAMALDTVSYSLAESEEQVKQKRKQVAEIGDRLTNLRIEEQQAISDLTHLLDSVRERHDVELLRILSDFHMRAVPGIDVKTRIDELKRLIDRMGAINPMAVEEYAETKERFAVKVEQKADVEQALEDLEVAITKMDRDSRRLFKETFEVVNEKFQEIFPRLFKGGLAKLQLTNPDDMLTTGVDIIAQPPGKRLGNIELMSGGEKALTAVSLLFAIFLHKPSPFCLLDEVDAPLDEANVGRFIEMVREMTDRSQFIVITHSKVSMEGSDALYGVTMEEPGVSKVVSVKLVRKGDAAKNGGTDSAQTA